MFLQVVSVTAGGTEVDQFLVSVFAKSGSILSERLHGPASPFCKYRLDPGPIQFYRRFTLPTQVT